MADITNFVFIVNQILDSDYWIEWSRELFYFTTNTAVECVTRLFQ